MVQGMRALLHAPRPVTDVMLKQLQGLGGSVSLRGNKCVGLALTTKKGATQYPGDNNRTVLDFSRGRLHWTLAIWAIWLTSSDIASHLPVIGGTSVALFKSACQIKNSNVWFVNDSLLWFGSFQEYNEPVYRTDLNDLYTNRTESVFNSSDSTAHWFL